MIWPIAAWPLGPSSTFTLIVVATIVRFLGVLGFISSIFFKTLDCVIIWVIGWLESCRICLLCCSDYIFDMLYFAYPCLHQSLLIEFCYAYWVFNTLWCYRVWDSWAYRVWRLMNLSSLRLTYMSSFRHIAMFIEFR